MERKIKDIKTKSYLYDVILLDPCRKQRFPVIFSIIAIVLCFKEVLFIIKNFSDYTWQHLFMCPSPFSSLYVQIMPHTYINHSRILVYFILSWYPNTNVIAELKNLKHNNNFSVSFFFFFLLTNSCPVLCVYENKERNVLNS